jgi:hypothetical protein
VQDLAPAEPDADAVDGERVVIYRGYWLACHGHSFCVEILSVTALVIARTSATIHDW